MIYNVYQVTKETKDVLCQCNSLEAAIDQIDAYVCDDKASGIFGYCNYSIEDANGVELSCTDFEIDESITDEVILNAIA